MEGGHLRAGRGNGIAGNLDTLKERRSVYIGKG